MHPGRWISLLLLVGAFGTFPLGAQPFARLVADLHSGAEVLNTSDLPAQLRGFQAAGARALFLSYRREGAACGLWATDGTATGTRPLADLCPDSSQGGPVDDAGPLASNGQIAYYRDSHLRLWRSDGTEAGTFVLAGDVKVSTSATPRLTPDGRYLLFQGCTVQDGCELWRSDGTGAGTKAVFSLYAGAKGGEPRELVFGAGRLFFLAGATGERAAIFEADPSGLGVVRRTTFGAGSRPQRLVPSVSKLFYLAVERGNFGDFQVGSIPLRAEEGAAEGSAGAEGGAEAEEGAAPDRAGAEGSAAAPVKTPIHPVSYFGLTALADRLYFIVSDIEAEIALWESDGTDRGTHVVPTEGSSGPSQLRALDGRILFLISAFYPEYRCSLWSLVPGDGAAHEVASGIEGSCLDDLDGSLTAFRGRTYFVAGDFQHGLDLWSADPRRGNPRKVLDLCPGGCGEAVPSLRLVGDRLLVTDSRAGLWRIGGPGEEPLRLAAVGPASYGFYGLDLAYAAGRIYFQGYDPLHLLQPWVSDLTPRGTRIGALLGPFAAGSEPSPIVSLGERAVFGACTPEGSALFASAGGNDGAPIRLGEPIPDCSSSPFYGGLRIGPVAFLQSFTEGQSGLVRTDGTPEGTFPLSVPDLGYVRQLAEAGGRLVFTADERDPDAIGSLALWTSDGTLEGTRRQFHLRLGGSPIAAGDPHGGLLFIAQEPEPPYYYRLFASDGTEAGTHRLLRVQIESFDPFLHPVRLNGRRYFFVDPLDNVARPELWSTDGTPEGTQAVEPPGGVHPADPADLVAFDGALYFFADVEPGVRGLWRSEGTPGSTRLFARLAPPHEQGYEVSAQPTVLQGRLYFVADDGHTGAELWSTDGTPEGTRIVLDLRPGPLSARIANLTPAGGRLYFAADDGRTGRELWTSDGTPEGTRFVQDLNPGEAGSSPGQLTPLEGGLFFSADDGRVGREPWFLPFGPGAACQPGPGVLCLEGGRYRVEAGYRTGEGGWAPADAQPLGEAGARFSFSGPEGLEAAVRLGGGEAAPGAKPVFVAGLTTQEHMVTVTDGRTGRARRYANPPGSAGSLADLGAFPEVLGLTAQAEPLRDREGPLPVPGKLSPSVCSPGPTRLCLLGGRFQVEVSYGRANRRTASGSALSDATGAFDLDPFARPGVAVKVVDGQAVNGRFWLFAGSLTQRPYTLKVTDTATGAVRTYTNLTGRSRSVADTHAF